MRCFFPAWVLVTCSLMTSWVQAQVELTWTLPNNRTLLMEPILADVRIANNTGQDLDLTPRGNARLSFDVEDQPTSTVPDTGQPLLRQPVIIPNGDSREVEVNLLNAYSVIKGQSYMLTPVLEFAGMRFFGDRRALEVQPGIELLKRDYGMPNSGAARQVSLRLINRDRNDRVFFRIDNSSTGYCLGVYDLGRVIRFFVPCLEQDRDSAFHVLHQSAPDRFVHSVFSYDGAPQGTTFYAAQIGSIKLIRDEDGGVKVQGGIPYTEDPEHPGTLVAPSLPPSHPYQTTLGEPAEKGSTSAKDQKADKKEKTHPTADKGKDHAGSNAISW